MTNSPPAITPALLCQRRFLIDVRGVAFLRGRSLRVIRQLAEGGTRNGVRGDVFERGFEWVWNVTANPACEKRDLRFWAREVIAPETCKGLKLPDVIKQVLPVTVRRFAPGRVVDLLLCDYQHLHNLKAAGQLPPGGFTPRAALVKFLTQRLICR